MFRGKYLRIRIKIFFKQSRIPIVVLFLWFLFGFIVFTTVYGFDVSTALGSAFFVISVPTGFTNAYSTWGGAVILGTVFAIILRNISEKYNPTEGCRMLAREMSGHYVVVGYTHLGERLVEYFRINALPYVLIEEDGEKVDHLLKEGDPIVVDSPLEKDTLSDANISKAKVVIVTTEDVEASTILTKRIRDLNKNCLLIVRNFHDELTEVLESLGANEIISSSKTAMSQILTRLNLKPTT